jgi:hypothetical protein
MIGMQIFIKKNAEGFVKPLSFYTIIKEIYTIERSENYF